MQLNLPGFSWAMFYGGDAGNIPRELAKLVRLQHLMLHNNQIEGEESSEMRSSEYPGLQGDTVECLA